MKAARLNAITSVASAARPKMRAIGAWRVCSSLMPASFIHTRANSSGEYHSAPIAKPSRVATSTAGMFRLSVSKRVLLAPVYGASQETEARQRR
jgi:hypothetical protein